MTSLIRPYNEYDGLNGTVARTSLMQPMDLEDYAVFFAGIGEPQPPRKRINMLHYYTGGRLGALWQMVSQNVHLTHVSKEWLQSNAYIPAVPPSRERKLRDAMAIASVLELCRADAGNDWWENEYPESDEVFDLPWINTT
eukprot:408855-Amphidinium_carterae.1